MRLRPVALALALAIPGTSAGEAPGAAGAAPAGEATAAAPAGEPWLGIHYQATVATQAHPAFSARYSGPNSLQPGAEAATSVVMDLFGTIRLWRGAVLHVQPELAGGTGLSRTLGVAAFPSGEVYRVGDPAPAVIIGRAFVRQFLGLGGGSIAVEDAPAQLPGARDRDGVTLTVGKVAVTDTLDNEPLSNDPHTRFMSWGLWSSAAYDYPADTRGYTWGVTADLSVDWWSARAGLFLEPKTANGMDLEWRVGQSRGVVAEFEARYTLGGRPGAARILGFLNRAPMGSYQQAVEDPAAAVDVTRTRAAGRTKAGLAASAHQDLGGGLGVFVRASWADGRNEAWAFTEIDHSAATGLVQSGARWRRPDDEVGIGLVVSGLSGDHRRYLAAGGLGFLLGDGALRYAPEVVGELFYRAAVTREVSFGVGYQPLFNPGYNADRGPAHVFTGRAHVAF